MEKHREKMTRLRHRRVKTYKQVKGQAQTERDRRGDRQRGRETDG